MDVLGEDGRKMQPNILRARPFRLYRYTGREERNLEALDLSDRLSNSQICLLNW